MIARVSIIVNSPGGIATRCTECGLLENLPTLIGLEFETEGAQVSSAPIECSGCGHQIGKILVTDGHAAP